MEDFRSQIIGSYYKLIKEDYTKTAHKSSNVIVIDVLISLSITAYCNNRYSSASKTPQVLMRVYYPRSKSIELMTLEQFLDAIVTGDKYEFLQDKTDLFKLKHSGANKSDQWWVTNEDGV